MWWCLLCPPERNKGDGMGWGWERETERERESENKKKQNQTFKNNKKKKFQRHQENRQRFMEKERAAAQAPTLTPFQSLYNSTTGFSSSATFASPTGVMKSILRPSKALKSASSNPSKHQVKKKKQIHHQSVGVFYLFIYFFVMQIIHSSCQQQPRSCSRLKHFYFGYRFFFLILF